MIYLDSAATTMEKPPSVLRALAAAMSHAASPGRGSHPAAMKAANIVFACRETAAELFHAEGPEQVVLTFHATHALNLAIRTLIKPGDTVLISGYEHNAVTRTLHAIPDVKIKVAAAPLFEPEQVLDAFRSGLTQEVSCVICNHVSNVFGMIQPVEEIAALCRERGVPFLLDASQSAGVLPVHMDELGAAFAAMPGHKGLYGPQGTGLLLCGQTAQPLLFGGTGSNSLRQDMPEFLPDRLEPGSLNVPGAAGLTAGMHFVQKTGTEAILRHERMLLRQAAEGLKKIPGIRCFAAGDIKRQTGVLSFCAEGTDCEVLGERLGAKGIAVRAGLHCSPLAHQTAGTLESGTVRLSFSAFNNAQQVERFLKVLPACLGV